MKQTYWDEKVGENYHFAPTREYQFLVDFIKANGESVFEAAVGTGIIPFMLREQGFKGRYLGTDYTKVFLDAAKKHNPNEEFQEYNMSDPIPLEDKLFDISIVHHGIEYVYPYEPTLKELARITKKYVIISMWVGLKDVNTIRFNEQGKWNVNYYGEDEFSEICDRIFTEGVMRAIVKNEDGKINYWYIFKP